MLKFAIEKSIFELNKDDTLHIRIPGVLKRELENIAKEEKITLTALIMMLAEEKVKAASRKG